MAKNPNKRKRNEETDKNNDSRKADIQINDPCDYQQMFQVTGPFQEAEPDDSLDKNEAFKRMMGELLYCYVQPISKQIENTTKRLSEIEKKLDNVAIDVSYLKRNLEGGGLAFKDLKKKREKLQSIMKKDTSLSALEVASGSNTGKLVTRILKAVFPISVLEVSSLTGACNGGPPLDKDKMAIIREYLYTKSGWEDSKLNRVFSARLKSFRRKNVKDADNRTEGSKPRNQRNNLIPENVGHSDEGSDCDNDGSEDSSE